MLAGSLDKAESMSLDNGYMNVWEFTTSQANGTIASLALTNYKGGATPFRNTLMVYDSASPGYSIVPVAFDGEKGYLYGVYNGKVYKRRLYTHVITVDSPRHGEPEEIMNLNIPSSEAYYRFHCPGYDGFMYSIFAEENRTKGTSTFNIKKYKVSDFSFDETGEQTVAVANSTTFRSARETIQLVTRMCVSNGYLYFLSYDNRTLYRVNLSNTADVKEYTFGDYSVYWIYPMHGGGLYIQPYRLETTATGSTQNRYRMGFFYPDGKYLIEDDYYVNSSFYMNNYCLYESEKILRYGYDNTGIAANYLGTICNLSSPVTKTSSQSMKITYTLTDA